MLLQIQRFNNSLSTIFPEESFPNLGRKYALAGGGMFQNEWLRELAATSIHHEKFYRIKRAIPISELPATKRNAQTSPAKSSEHQDNNLNDLFLE